MAVTDGYSEGDDEMTFDRTNRGTLNKNQRKSAETHADYTGQINIEGRDYWLNGWVKESASGKFISLSVKLKDGTAARPEPTPVRTASATPLDDDIPF